jgi:hypothetical protein
MLPFKQKAHTSVEEIIVDFPIDMVCMLQIIGRIRLVLLEHYPQPFLVRKKWQMTFRLKG